MSQPPELDQVLAELIPVYNPWELANWFAQHNPWIAECFPADVLEYDSSSAVLRVLMPMLIPALYNDALIKSTMVTRHSEKIPLSFQTAIIDVLDSLQSGKTMRICNDHDRLPLLSQIIARFGAGVTIDHVQRHLGEIVIDFKVIDLRTLRFRRF